MKVECCDNCKRPFEQFDTDKEDVKGLGFVVADGDIEVLMSDFNYAFAVFTELQERQTGEEYWCVNCVEAVNGEG